MNLFKPLASNLPQEKVEASKNASLNQLMTKFDTKTQMKTINYYFARESRATTNKTRHVHSHPAIDLGTHGKLQSVLSAHRGGEPTFNTCVCTRPANPDKKFIFPAAHVKNSAPAAFSVALSEGGK
jgi:hypothetical protein